jgi:hypothetical protein
VWGGLHGAIGGLRIGKAFQDPQKMKEVTTFMKEHGLSESASREESQSWIENLSPQDKAEFQKMIMKSVKMKDIAGFGSTFAVCVIVFGMIGFLSGILTKAWKYVGILLLISFLLNNPVLRFRVIHDMPFSQKAIIVLVSQFLICYIFAYLGASLSIKVARKRQKKMEAKP